MKNTWLTIILIIVVGMGLLLFGCAKKTVPEKAEEVKPPVEQAAPMAPTPAQPQGGVAAPAPLPVLAEEIKTFEDNDIHFDFDKYDLTPPALEILNQKASFLKSHPDLTIRIEGNCDERGTTEYNLALGDRRAKSAENYLADLGISKERISVISYGKEKPLDPGHNEEAWAKNRRDHFVVMNK